MPEDIFESAEVTVEDDGVRRDRWGRYLFPVGRSTRAHTRVSTFAKTISDTYTLSLWQQRMAIKGLVSRPDLMALAAATPLSDRETLNKIVSSASAAANIHAAANMGSAYHGWTAAIDAGEPVVIPEAYAADLKAYADMIKDHGITGFPEWIEKVVRIPAYGLGGKFDRIVKHRGELVIGDLKTGRDLSYGWGEIAVQLACYAHAEAIFDPLTEVYTPMPEVSKTRGLVFHLPIGEATATLYEVDLAQGWEAARLCAATREWRKNRSLARPLSVTLPGDTASATYAQRLSLASSRGELSTVWREAVARGEWTDALESLGKARLAELSAG